MDSGKVREIEALAARSEALHQAGDMAGAEAACRKLVALLPDHPMVHYNLARVLKDRGKADAALAALRKALALAPGMAEGWLNLGNLLGEAGQWAEAEAAFARGLAARPEFWPLLAGLGRVKAATGQFAEAEALLRRALALAPQAPPVLLNLANVLLDHGDPAEATSLYDRALALAPTMAEALLGAGNAARKGGDMGRALDFYRRAAAAKPEDLSLRARLAEARFAVCDWSGLESLRAEIIEPGLKSGKGEIGPMMALAFPLALEPKALLAFARGRAERVAAEVAPLRSKLPPARPGPRERLTIGYLSADFHDHPTSHLMRGMFPAHDRAHFRVVTLALDADDGSDYRRFVRAHSDAFLELGPLPALEAARAIRAEGVDILVDINVHTRGNRLQITSLRPAPVAVNWLGLPGSSGSAALDWALVDGVVCPPGFEADFSERLAVLPHCYQANDRSQETAAETPSRAECGLPDDGFVFCCFNQAFKIEPQVFGCWMRLLGRVPGSVLWLLDGGAEMQANLRREAQERSIDPARLVFAGRRPKAVHLARHRHADLFLDTLFYNAHTTASDALWAGVPVVTTPGRAFAARVAASLLAQAGLEEMICPDLAAYEDLAAHLALAPAELAAVKGRLAANRLSTPLFDTAGFVRDMERAYGMIWAETCAGRKPRRLEIPPV